MRKTITISVSDEMHALIHEGTRSHFYCTVSEYIRFLVRRDQMPLVIKKEELVYFPPRTANQCLEEARAMSDADQSIGDE